MWNKISCTKLQLPPEPLTSGLPPTDFRSLCLLSSTEFVEPPRTKFLSTPLCSDNHCTEVDSRESTQVCSDISLTSTPQCPTSNKFLSCYVCLQAEGNQWHHLQLKYFRLKDIDCDSQQTGTALIAPLPSAMLNSLGSNWWHRLSSIICVLSYKSKPSLGYSWWHHQENTQAHVDSHLTFTHTGCRTNFANADIETWSTTMREDRILRPYKRRVLRKILPPEREMR